MENDGMETMEFQGKDAVMEAQVEEKTEREFEEVMAALPKILYHTSKLKEPNPIDRVGMGLGIMANEIKKNAETFKDVAKKNEKAMKAAGLWGD